MSLRVLMLLGLLALVAALAACGDDDGEDEVQRACSTGLPDSSAWDGGVLVNASQNGGRVAVDEFNEFLAEAEAPLSTSPCDAARVYLKLDERQTQEGIEFQVAAKPGDSPDAEVEVTLAKLADDSILAERWTFTFEAGEGDRTRLADLVRTQSCQPGRGHAAFTAEPCV